MSNDNTPTLENDVPMPTGGTRRSPLWGLLEQMEFGQSFFTTNSGIGGYVSTMKKETEADFATRSVTEDDVEGTRVWRTA